MTWLWVLGGLLTAVVALVVGNRKLRRRAVGFAGRRFKRRPAARATRTARAGGRAAPRAPLAGYGQRPGRPIVRTAKCSAACRTSRKPAYTNGVLTCDCPCGGRDHGRYRPGTNASLRSKPRVSGAAAPKRPVAVAQRSPVAARPVSLAPVPAPVPSRPAERVHDPREDRGWKSLKPSSQEAMSAHAKASPGCVSGTVSARTFRDNRTDPPTISQELTCDTCRAEL